MDRKTLPGDDSEPPKSGGSESSPGIVFSIQNRSGRLKMCQKIDFQKYFFDKIFQNFSKFEKIGFWAGCFQKFKSQRFDK